MAPSCLTGNVILPQSTSTLLPRYSSAAAYGGPSEGISNRQRHSKPFDRPDLASRSVRWLTSVSPPHPLDFADAARLGPRGIFKRLTQGPFPDYFPGVLRISGRGWRCHRSYVNLSFPGCFPYAPRGILPVCGDPVVGG